MVDLGLGFLSGMFGPGMSKAGSVLISAMWSILGITIAAIFGYFIYVWYKNKTFFTTPISITRLMENGVEKTNHNSVGGVFWNKGIKDFKIKIPKQRKPHLLGYVPNMSLSNDSDGRLYFIASGDGTLLQQYKKEWITEIEMEKDGNKYNKSLICVPVPISTKRFTINSIKNWRDTIEKNKLTAFGIALGSFIIMVIAHLISLFIQTRIKCGVG